ncbi:glycosyltransferase family 2 protein [Methylobacterium sp. J-030]|uniref:tetratricopeptide repeat-containing glycosyltransferase n=1 Tax=Methylobacterium sp. J-030 TaxID=2836627 RepID=UPI001FB8D1ED|nr:glycosyltransferase [Methylobacterium sp. J-030]MCJ2069714.1 glycosyltransferase family 2 protein [Methylobacterium sp. J-030]
MIVKNEAHVIRRCLETVRPIIDHWVVVDTGSSDGTQDVIRAAMADMPGFLVERPWVDFAHNRSEALHLARPHADFTLVIDADDELVIPPGFIMPKLEAPAYDLTILDSFTRYPRTQLVNNMYPWRYLGVVHEFIDCPIASWRGSLPLAMRRGEDGARHLDSKTYERDVALLEKALKTETDPFLVARYTFYLAQSYRDIGDYANALKYYSRRAEQGIWDEEVYISLLSVAYIMEAANEPVHKILAVYDRAIATRPDRAEARHGASRCCRGKRRFVEGFHYAEAGLPTTMDSAGLFIQNWIYQYGLRDEHAVNAYNTGQFRACLTSCLDILGKPDIPADVRARIARLAREALSKMVDPIWGFATSSYRTPFMPLWQV